MHRLDSKSGIYLQKLTRVGILMVAHLLESSLYFTSSLFCVLSIYFHFRISSSLLYCRLPMPVEINDCQK